MFCLCFGSISTWFVTLFAKAGFHLTKGEYVVSHPLLFTKLFFVLKLVTVEGVIGDVESFDILSDALENLIWTLGHFLLVIYICCKSYINFSKNKMIELKYFLTNN